MTREITEEQAIELLEKEKSYMIGHGGDRQAIALDMAINAIKLLKTGLLKDCESCEAEKEPFEDCISRQEVTEYLEKLLDGRFNDSMSAAIMGIKDNINAMRPVTNVREWTPVSEKLPDPQEDGDKNYSDTVLVTVGLGKDNDLHVSEAYYCFENKKWYSMRFAIGEVTAWMPKPEPYKAESWRK